MKSNYSEKEFAMIQRLSPHWAKIIEQNMDQNIEAPQVLNVIALQCFMENTQGNVVDSLRRCCKACVNCNPYRKTVEYDDLITL
jgi:hypothetical protein